MHFRRVVVEILMDLTMQVLKLNCQAKCDEDG